MMSVGAAFAGIGGFECGFEATGRFETRWHSEIKIPALKVLADRFPHAAALGDIQASRDVPHVDVLCGGPPCQGISIAQSYGRHGLNDPRSHLFYDYLLLIDRVRPRWIVMEQVLGLRTANSGRDYQTVINALTELGYAVGVVAANTAAYAPQARGRIFFVGSPTQRQTAAALLPVRADGAVDPRTYRPSIWKRAAPPDHLARAYRKTRRASSDEDGEGWIATELTNTLTAFDASLPRQTTLVVDDWGIRILTPIEWERCHGFPDDWTRAAGSDSARYDLLGNAVSPPIAQRIAQGITEAER